MLDDPLGREPQLGVAAGANPPRSAFALVEQVVHGHGRVRVLEEAGQYSFFVSANQYEARIPLQGRGNVIAECCGKESARAEACSHIAEK